MRTTLTNNKRAILYVRVSSDEQVKGTSLDDQEIKCKEYCVEHSFDVVETFRDEGASAKSIDRVEFLNAIEFCRKNKIEAFVVVRVDRFARNTEDHFSVRKILLDYGTTLHSVTEPIGDSPVGKLVETVLAGTSEFDNAIRTIRCTGGMSRKIKEGIYPWKPPLGYICANFKKRDMKKLEHDKPDLMRFEIIKRLLKYVLETGEVSNKKLAELVNSWGLTLRNGKKITPQQIDRILSNKFYAGIIINPFEKEEEKQVGKHEAMISEEEFEKIQLMRKGKYKHFYVKKNKDNPEFPLSRFLKCKYCEGGLAGSFSKGQTKRVPYYHCHNKKCDFYGKTIPREMAHDDFLNLLTLITPKESFLKLFQEIVVDVWKDNKAIFEDVQKTQNKDISDLKQKRVEYAEMIRKQVISEDFGKEVISQIDNEILTKKISASEANIETLDIEAAISYATKFIDDLPRVWVDLPIDKRKKFQQLVFPDGISYSKKEKVGTYKLGLIYELNQKTLDESRQNETLVDPRRFELLTSSLQMRRSTN